MAMVAREPDVRVKSRAVGVGRAGRRRRPRARSFLENRPNPNGVWGAWTSPRKRSVSSREAAHDGMYDVSGEEFDKRIIWNPIKLPGPTPAETSGSRPR